MENAPDLIAKFARFINLKSLRERTKEEYVRWVRRLAKHGGVACASLMGEEEALGFLHHLQRQHNYESSTLNQAVCGLRLFFRDHLGRDDWKCWSQIRIKRQAPLPTLRAQQPHPVHQERRPGLPLLRQLPRAHPLSLRQA